MRHIAMVLLLLSLPAAILRAEDDTLRDLGTNAAPGEIASSLPLLPAAMAAFAVGEGDDPELFPFDGVDDQEGEAGQQHASCAVFSLRVAERMLFDYLDRRLGVPCEIEAEAGTTLFVVGDRFPEFDFGFVKDGRAGHSCLPAYFASISPNTCTAWRPLALPSRTMPTRRPISASVWEFSESVSGESRLKIRSWASPARSLGGNTSACDLISSRVAFIRRRIWPPRAGSQPALPRRTELIG